MDVFVIESCVCCLGSSGVSMGRRGVGALIFAFFLGYLHTSTIYLLLAMDGSLGYSYSQHIIYFLKHLT